MLQTTLSLHTGPSFPPKLVVMPPAAVVASVVLVLVGPIDDVDVTVVVGKVPVVVDCSPVVVASVDDGPFEEAVVLSVVSTTSSDVLATTEEHHVQSGVE